MVKTKHSPIDHNFPESVAEVLAQARKNAKTAVNLSMVYANDQIGETVFSQFENLPAVSTGRKFFLIRSHYLKLMRITNVDKRHFYEIDSSLTSFRKYSKIIPKGKFRIFPMYLEFFFEEPEIALKRLNIIHKLLVQFKYREV